MLKYQVEGLGEISLFVNKGVIAEFEDYFGKPWYLSVSQGFTNKHWFVFIHKAYEVAQIRLRKEPTLTLKELEAFIDDKTFLEMIKAIDAELEKVLEISKIKQAIDSAIESQDKKKIEAGS